MQSRARRPVMIARAEIVAYLGGSLNERLLLREPTPLARQQPTIDRLGIPPQPGAQSGQLPVRIGKHGPFSDAEQSLSGNEQPIGDGQVSGRAVPPHLPGDPRGERVDLDPRLQRLVVSTDGDRPAAVGLREVAQDANTDRFHRRLGDEHDAARPPAVIG